MPPDGRVNATGRTTAREDAPANTGVGVRASGAGASPAPLGGDTVRDDAKRTSTAHDVAE